MAFTPRKRWAPIARSDLLIVNKKDIAANVEVDLAQMDFEATQDCKCRSHVFTHLKHSEGIREGKSLLRTLVVFKNQ